MSHLKISALMTRDVATVREDTPFHEIAEVLAGRHVSAVPVVDADNRVLGVVSEADLLHKVEFADDLAEGASILERRTHRLARHKATGHVAKDLMSAPAVTVMDGTTVVKAARLLEASGIKRMPVVNDLGRLVGIVSRADLLKVYLRADADIRDEVTNQVLRRLLWIDPTEVKVEVDGGAVTLAGEIEQRSLIDITVRLVGAVDGVVEVDDQLTWRVDDTVTPEARYYRPLV
jgi:CBS-domain-containing membrane protein